MNDTELDQLLDVWEAPAPPESMRQGLRARFPRSERIPFPRPLRWAVVGLLASAVFALGIAKSNDSAWGAPITAFLDHAHNHIAMMIDAHRSVAIMVEVRLSQPRVYVDGKPAAPPEYGRGVALRVRIPGKGVYGILPVRHADQLLGPDGRPAGWVEAGSIHDNVVEFEVDGRQVRVECNKTLTDTDRPVFIRRLPE